MNHKLQNADLYFQQHLNKLSKNQMHYKKGSQGNEQHPEDVKKNSHFRAENPFPVHLLYRLNGSNKYYK